jgi:HSP20 family protein
MALSTNFNFFDEMDRSMESALNRFFGYRSLFDDYSNFGNSRLGNMSVDVVDDKDHIEILADVPGFTADEIQIHQQDGYISIQAEKTTSIKERNKEQKHYRQERSYRKFFRTFVLPENIDVEKISADLENGVLKVSLPKLENIPSKRRKQIKVNTSNSKAIKN